MVGSIRSKSIKQAKSPVLDRVYIAILLVVFGGIVLQGPISVGLGTLWPHYDLLIKSWKEILLLVAGLLSLVLLRRKGQYGILRQPLMLFIAVYALLHVVLAVAMWHGTQATLAGLMIDLRYILFFGLVYIAISLYPDLKRQFLLTFMVGGIVVVTFAMLQVFILPADILSYIGYGKTTIEPYLTVDLNQSYIRINSTLRGPNPLGAYAVIILTFITAAYLKRKIPPITKSRIMAAILLVGGAVALWASYSRSAVIAGVVGIGIVAVVSLSSKISRRTWIIGSVVLFGLVGGLALNSRSNFVSNVILHDNPSSTSSTKSDAGHINSLQDGIALAAANPLGSGVGSTGSASLYTKQPLIIENQYLLIAHEVGWLGLGLFAVIYVAVMIELWRRRNSYAALGVFASGVGMGIIGILLPVWVDDTVSIIWWGLAAVAIGSLRMAGGRWNMLNRKKVAND